MVGTGVSSASAGVVGTMTHGVSHARIYGVSCAGTCGCVKADNNNVGMNVGMHEWHGAGDICGRRVVKTWECMEMGKSRCVWCKM